MRMISGAFKRYILCYPHGYAETKDHLTYDDYNNSNHAKVAIIDTITGLRRVGHNKWATIDIIESEPSLADNSPDDIIGYRNAATPRKHQSKFDFPTTEDI